MGFQRDTMERGYEALRQAMLRADAKGMQSALTERAFQKMGGLPDGTLKPDAVEALAQMQQVMDEYMPELGGDFTVEVVADAGARGDFRKRCAGILRQHRICGFNEGVFGGGAESIVHATYLSHSRCMCQAPRIQHCVYLWVRHTHMEKTAMNPAFGG